MVTSPGKMRERLMFYRRSGTPDGMGNQLAAWSWLYGPVSARVQPLKGSELVVDQRLSGINIYNIYIRSSIVARGITAEDKAVNTRTGETFNITALNNLDERNAEIVFTAKSGGSEK